MSGVLDHLRGGVIVSVQAADGSALDDPNVISAMAAAAEAGGAVALRIAGRKNIEAVRARTELPIVGIIKRRYEGFEPYITPTLTDVREILECGAQIVAFDATGRVRPGRLGTAEMVGAIQQAGAFAMADCARAGDGPAAQAAGADIIATTLCGYTKETAFEELPALELVRQFSRLDAFTICEGGIHDPSQGAAALAAGADAIVVGTAITNIEWVAKRYVSALQRSSRA